MHLFGKSFRLTYLLSLLLLLGCDSNQEDEERGPEPTRPLSQAEAKMVQSDNAFGLNLFNTLSEDAPEENIFISPLSISMALGMTLNGADGSTRDEMIATLQKQGLTETAINNSYKSLLDLFTNLDPKVQLSIANSIWYRDGFPVLPLFLEVNKAHFDAEVSSLDFAQSISKDIINGWVDDKTNGLIDKIIDEIKPNDIMYLINAIYFKGSWTYQFDPEETREEVFNNQNGAKPVVPLMSYLNTVLFAANDQVSLIDLPYGDSLYSMTIVLPNNPEGLGELTSSIDANTWNAWIEDLEPAELEVYMPKFELAYERTLGDMLSDMGMQEAFLPNVANFSRINPDRKDLHISKVLHKSFVEINEEGTEAAAVTSVSIGVTSIDPISTPAAFRVDRPFLFVIREQYSGAILFIGQVQNL